MDNLNYQIQDNVIEYLDIINIINLSQTDKYYYDISQ